jgi:hypothetical protein
MPLPHGLCIVRGDDGTDEVGESLPVEGADHLFLQLVRPRAASEGGLVLARVVEILPQGIRSNLLSGSSPFSRSRLFRLGPASFFSDGVSRFRIVWMVQGMIDMFLQKGTANIGVGQ